MVSQMQVDKGLPLHLPLEVEGVGNSAATKGVGPQQMGCNANLFGLQLLRPRMLNCCGWYLLVSQAKIPRDILLCRVS